jgi:CheY-like chemotaxis protein
MPPEPAEEAAAKLAHDFNNLLLAVTACLELIRSRSTEPRIADIATRGMDTLGRGGELVERLLALTTHRAPALVAPAPRRQPVILVIDDDDDVRLVLSELLQSLGYDLVEASDGPAGIAALEREPPPDLAIVDYALPGRNGADVADELLDRRPDLAIVFATGYPGAEADDPRLRHRPVLSKPFRIAELSKTVTAALGR